MIRQRLLESKTLYLQMAFNQANSLDLAYRKAGSYSPMAPQFGHTTTVVIPNQAQKPGMTL